MSKPRVLLIGLDSGDAELIEAWMASGHMPNFARLRSEGTYARVGTTAEVMHVSAWPTLYTGTTPGQHGLYHAYQFNAGQQLIHRPDPSTSGQPPFWKFLDDAGRKCIVFDAFMDYKLPGFKGLQVTEYGTWTWFGDPTSTPNNLLNQIKSRFGAYPAPEHTLQVTVPDDPLAFRDKLIAGTQVKSKVTQALLRENDWDMSFVTFGEPHGAGHYLWHFDDPQYPNQPANAAHRGLNFMRSIYSALDEAIGDIVAAAGDDVTVMITSGDGMGPNYAGAHLMPEFLHRMDLFHSGSVGQAANTQVKARAPKKGVMSLLREAVPLGLRQQVSRCLPRSVRTNMSVKWMNTGIDWSRSKVFAIPNSNEGYFRINLRGREPLGNVGAGMEYDELLGRLREQLDVMVNPDTGVKAGETVALVDELYTGSRRKDLPDALITWNAEARVGAAVATPGLGEIRKVAGWQASPFYTGNHRPNAFMLARGPALPAGTPLTDGHIRDIAPTILAMLGVEQPAHFEGRPLSGFV